jgi:uncharacterized protein (DUF302 family)
MLDSTRSSDGVLTKPSSTSVPQTIGGLRRLIADRGFTVFNVIDRRAISADPRLDPGHNVRRRNARSEW